jgi:cytochrome c oxidase cbb3-type subunit IV
MYSEFFRAHHLIDLPLVSSVLFVALFLGVVAWLFLERRQRFEQAALQPLEDDERSVRS